MSKDCRPPIPTEITLDEVKGWLDRSGYLNEGRAKWLISEVEAKEKEIAELKMAKRGLDFNLLHQFLHEGISRWIELEIKLIRTEETSSGLVISLTHGNKRLVELLTPRDLDIEGVATERILANVTIRKWEKYTEDSPGVEI